MNLLSIRKCLVVTAHPDDAELAVGGTIAKLAAAGAEVRIFILTSSGNTAGESALRLKAAEASAAILGASVSYYRDGALKQVTDEKQSVLVSGLDRVIADYAPDLILTHHPEDSHEDHIATGRAVISCSRRYSGTIAVFPPNEHRSCLNAGFHGNVLVDVSEHIDQKVQAIDTHNFDGKSYKELDLRLVRDFARYCGSRASCGYAETLNLLQARW